MRKSTIALTFGMAGFLTGMLLFDKLSAQNTTRYGEDRAQIEDLQARYLLPWISTTRSSMPLRSHPTVFSTTGVVK